MEAHERLKLIISRLGMSQSEFAQKMDIQRSLISHLLSGRNKPSFSFFEKLLETFPEINLEWLIAEKGEMLKKQTDKQTTATLFDQNESNKNQEIKDLTSPYQESHTKVLYNVDKPLKKNTENRPEIEKILIIYADKTFEEIVPKNNEQI